MADYAISNVPRRVVYAASGVGPYAFTFEILDQTDIAVYKGSTLLTLTTDYTVSINGTTGTGEVTLVATAGTSNITIVGAKNIQRTSDFTTGGDLFADTLNDELDNQTIYIQQVAETAERGLKAPVTDPTDIAMTLPAKDGRKGKVLAFDSTTGNPVAGPSLDSMVTVIEQSAYINAVGENIDDVIAVADNEANIDTVAGVSSAVTTVATNISNVNTVADDLNEPTSEIHVVGTNIANVNTVGTNIASVNTVATNIANVNTVAGISGNVTTVAGISSAVTGVNAISSAVTSVNSNSTNINAVAGNATNINTVAGISGNISTVAGISSDVTTVAGIDQTDLSDVADIDSEIATVAGIAGNVTTVAGISANVTSVANNASNINQVASDTVAINSASANATSAAASALSASNSATSASASAAAASAVALGNEPVRHSVRPSLLLDFANTKTLDPRITFTRASTATYYDGVTVAKAEENLFLQSQNFATSWNLSSATRTTGVTDPAGGTTAATITKTADANNTFFQNVPMNTQNATFTMSAYLKGSGTVTFRGDNYINQNLNQVITLTSDWQRYTFTATFNGTGSTTVALFSFNLPSGSASSFDIAFAQVELRSSVTAYTATTTAPITNYIPALQTAASGVARFEHNPVTGESLGLEIEEQRTNLFTYSDDFSNAAWAKVSSTVTSNTIVAPDGSLTGDKLIGNSGSAGRTNQQLNISAVSHTFSVYAKKAEMSWMYIMQAATGGAYFDLQNGAVGTVDAGHTATITSVGNGWYRCSITFTGAAVLTTYRIYSTTANGTLATGDGYSGIYIWGAQLEAGSFATSYIPTVASQVTRSADSATMTGTNFSSWYRADEGTLYGEFNGIPELTSAQQAFKVWDGANNNRTQISLVGSSAFFVRMVNGGALQANLGGTPTANTAYKIAGAYKTNDTAVSISGASALTDTSCILPVVNQAVISSNIGTIKKLAYYPARLTNSELQGLTTV